MIHFYRIYKLFYFISLGVFLAVTVYNLVKSFTDILQVLEEFPPDIRDKVRSMLLSKSRYFLGQSLRNNIRYVWLLLILFIIEIGINVLILV